MKAPGAWIQTGLAAGAMVAAYLTWQRPPEVTSADDVVVLDASKNSLERVRFEDGTRFLELFKENKGETLYWVKQGYLEGKAPKPPRPTSADGGATDAGDVLPFQEPPPTRDMHANEQASKLWQRFTPFMAARALGKLAPEKTKELGLDESERRLSLTVGGALKAFRVSPSAGTAGTYIQDTGEGRVYLLQASLLSELDPTAQMLVDRRLHTFKPTEFDEFTVKLGEASRTFVQKGGDIAQTTQVAPKEKPDKPDDFARNWHDKIWNRLIVTEVLGRGEIPKKGDPKVAMRVDYFWHGSPKGWVELGEATKGEMFARSENTAGWVGVHQGVDEYIIEAKRVLEPR